MEPEKAKLLGLARIETVKHPDGRLVSVGDSVLIRGKVLRIHDSGFMLVSVEGPEKQPAILLHCSNTSKE